MSASYCTNCSNKITCGCQKRLASNGVYVCSKCVAAYEENLKAQQQLKQPPTQ